MKFSVLNTDLYCVTGEDFSQGRKNIEVVKDMISAGIKIIQYREKNKSLKEKYEQCKIIRELTKDAGVTFIVNDNIDIASEKVPEIKPEPEPKLEPELEDVPVKQEEVAY